MARHRDLLAGDAWPALAPLNERFGAPPHPHSGVPLHFVEQSPSLLADGRHYESRIHDTGRSRRARRAGTTC
jgi:hypothetical protein